MDTHYFGPIVLWGTAHWYQCGSPWELDATPNFAARLEEAKIAWLPKSPLSFPLKDWQSARYAISTIEAATGRANADGAGVDRGEVS